MQIRELEQRDLANVSSLCLEAFADSVASGLSDKGIETFQDIASVDGFSKRLQENNTILVCEENANLIGVIELKNGRHLAMLFVATSCQGKGVGRALVSAIMPYCETDLVTVNASINSIPAYSSYGFVHAGDSDERLGLKYQPMEFRRETEAAYLPFSITNPALRKDLTRTPSLDKFDRH